MGSDKEYLKGLKDASPQDRKVAEDLERAEVEQGIPQPAEETRKEGGNEHGRG
jgi:hypothetical protein